MEISILVSKKRGFFSLLPLGFNTMQFRFLTSTSRSSRLPPSLGLKELEPNHSEVNRLRMWLNYIGELQEMSLIKIMGKGEGIDDWPHPLQPHIQSRHLLYSYFPSPPSPPPPPPPAPHSSLQLQSAIGLDNLDFLRPLVPV